MKTVSTHASTSRYLHEPVWIPRRRIRSGQVPENILHWLLDRASLTQRIVAACSGEFRVKVLAQAWIRPMSNESQALGMDIGGYALVRQVQLLCDDVPWVYARTVIPRSTLTGRERRLAFLKSKSLGAMLFADPSMRRSEVQVVRATVRDRLHGVVAGHLEHAPAEIWGRRSVFTLRDKPLLVSELFLPVVEDKGF
jgi:chorismate--pyruvate lyase